MPNLQNAKKALRVSARKRVMNDKRRKVMKETIKDVKALVGAEKKIIVESLSKAYKAIDKAAKRGIIKKNTANRRKARLAKATKAKK
jgi:small subunit ribosomal protein S20